MVTFAKHWRSFSIINFQTIRSAEYLGNCKYYSLTYNIIFTTATTVSRKARKKFGESKSASMGDEPRFEDYHQVPKFVHARVNL